MEKNDGISIELVDDELVIKGSREDLVELANYIVNVSTLDSEIDHLHLDDLTLIREDSKIKNLIIEKIK